MVEPSNCEIVPVEQSAELSEIIEAVRAEVESIDPGPLPQTEDDRTLYRVLRLRSRLCDEHCRVKEAMESMLREYERRISGIDFHYTPLLSDIVKRKLGSGKKKSIKTPFGIAGFRTTPNKVDVTEPKNLLPFFWRTIPEEKQPDKVVIAEHIKTTGEVPDGCVMIDGVEKFYIK